MTPGGSIPITAKLLLASLFLLGPVLAIAIAVITPAAIAVPLADDALFFVRYGSQFLAGGSFAWNPGAAPSFGSTSQLYQFIVTAFQTVLDNPVQAVSLAARFSGFLATVVVLKLAGRYAAEARETGMGSSAGALIMLLAGTGFVLNPDFASIARSGMDTAMSAAILAIYVALIERAGDRHWQLCAVISVGGWRLVLARPELVLIAAAVPITLLVGDPALRRSAFMGLLRFSALTGCSIAIPWVYYATPLPLPPHGKPL